MPGQLNKVGPWPRGMVNAYDPELMPDDALIECINFDVKDDGILKARPSFKITDQKLAQGTVKLIGSIKNNMGDDEVWVYWQNALDTASQLYTMYAPYLNFSYVTQTMPSTAPNLGYNSVIRYADSIYVYSSLSASLRKPVTSNTLTALTNVPFSTYSLLFKNRAFLVGTDGYTIYFSKPGSPDIWINDPDAGFFKVETGDGQKITHINQIGDQIIIFKEKKTYAFSYQEHPANDGYLRVISTSGANDSLVHENSLYTCDGKQVYRLINGNYQNISEGVVFKNYTYGGWLSIIGDKLSLVYVSDQGTYSSFNSGSDISNINQNRYMYVMNLKTRAWSRYVFYSNVSGGHPLIEGKGYFCEAFGQNQHATLFPCTSSGHSSQQLFGFQWNKPPVVDVYDFDARFTPRYLIRTKQYNFGTYNMWKRLYYWMLDRNDLGTLSSVNRIRLNSSPHITIESRIENSAGTDGRVNNTSTRFKSISVEFDINTGGLAPGSGDVPPVVRGIVISTGMSKPVSM